MQQNWYDTNDSDNMSLENEKESTDSGVSNSIFEYKPYQEVGHSYSLHDPDHISILGFHVSKTK